MDDVKLREREIKSLQKYITHLLQEKNDLQTKIKVYKFIIIYNIYNNNKIGNKTVLY